MFNFPTLFSLFPFNFTGNVLKVVQKGLMPRREVTALGVMTTVQCVAARLRTSA